MKTEVCRHCPGHWLRQPHP
jgi:hypothetical protein